MAGSLAIYATCKVLWDTSLVAESPRPFYLCTLTSLPHAIRMQCVLYLDESLVDRLSSECKVGTTMQPTNYNHPCCGTQLVQKKKKSTRA